MRDRLSLSWRTLRNSERAAQGARRLLPPALTLLIFFFIFQRVPFSKLLEALQVADYPRFLALMLPNCLFYFAWDTLVLAYLMRWFHGPIRYRDLLPVRAVTYVVSLMNTNLARAATALYLTRQTGAPFWQIASTVIFLTLLELTHLALWATGGMASFRSEVPHALFWIPGGFALFWLLFLLPLRLDIALWGWLWKGHARIREWSIFRTFVQAPFKRYVQVVLLRMPMFGVSLLIHFLAVKTFGFEIPLSQMMAFLPIIFMLAALPITVAHLGTTQAAWVFFLGGYAAPSQLLAYSLASHLAFMLTRGLLGLIFLPRAYKELFGPLRTQPLLAAREASPLPSSSR